VIADISLAPLGSLAPRPGPFPFPATESQFAYNFFSCHTNEQPARKENAYRTPSSVHLPQHVHLPPPAVSLRPATSAPFLYGAISVALSRFALKCIIFAGCLLQQQQVLPRPSFWPLSRILVLKLRNQLVMTMHNSRLPCILALPPCCIPICECFCVQEDAIDTRLEIKIPSEVEKSAQHQLVYNS